MPNEDDLIKKLSFDQFSRQKIVAYLINESFVNRDNKTALNIIDIGGHLGRTSDFMPNDKVTVLDVFDENYDNYIKGDATSMIFKDNSFDIACSFDVLEHIPREKRQTFINEAVRVSKIGFFMAIPVDIENKVSSAEVLLNDFYMNIFNEDHQWLKEHIDYMIPDEKEVNNLIKNSGASSVSISSNQIGDWQLMQMLLFASSSIPDIVGEVSDINTWYNKNILSLDSMVDVGYRKIIFISKDVENITSVKKTINKLEAYNSEDSKVTVNKQTFNEFSETLSLIIKKYNLSYEQNQYINKTNKDLINEIINLKKLHKIDKTHIEKLNLEISSIHNSKTWKLIHPLREIIGYINKSIKKN
ncbi:MAG: class I SAM-dependent methyltransferase [Candidatus Saccharibacteria bacterium]